MSRSLSLVALLPLLAGTACYHARIETGATPSTVVIDKSWSSSWILGLVPPEILETASKCPDGVARVETKLGFLNQVVGILTIGIYTPMDVRVTCAQARTAGGSPPPSDIVIEAGASTQQMLDAFQQAADDSKRLERPVFVQF